MAKWLRSTRKVEWPVEVYLTSPGNLDAVKRTLATIGAVVTGENADFGNGSLSAFVPFGVVEALPFSYARGWPT